MKVRLGLRIWKRLLLAAVVVAVAVIVISDRQRRAVVRAVDMGLVAADYHPPLPRKKILNNTGVRGQAYGALVPSMLNRDYRYDRAIRDAVAQ